MAGFLLVICLDLVMHTLSLALFFCSSYLNPMPYMQSECVTDGSTTDCSYTQVIPFATADWPLVMGLSVVIALGVAYFVRYVFFR